MSKKTTKKYGARRVAFATMNARPARMAGMKRQIIGLAAHLDQLPFP